MRTIYSCRLNMWFSSKSPDGYLDQTFEEVGMTQWTKHFDNSNGAEGINLNINNNESGYLAIVSSVSWLSYTKNLIYSGLV